MISKINALQAYQKAMGDQMRIERQVSNSLGKTDAPQQSFTDAIQSSIGKVNEMQETKNAMVESFAAGDNTNVHELMIQLQKAGMAMSVTSAVRNKVMNAYQEILRMQF